MTHTNSQYKATLRMPHFADWIRSWETICVESTSSKDLSNKRTYAKTSSNNTSFSNSAHLMVSDFDRYSSNVWTIERWPRWTGFKRSPGYQCRQVTPYDMGSRDPRTVRFPNFSWSGPVQDFLSFVGPGPIRPDIFLTLLVLVRSILLVLVRGSLMNCRTLWLRKSTVALY